jgi:hypothetical protein
MRSAAQAVHSPLTTVASLQLEDFSQQRQEVGVAGLKNARHELRSERRQPKLGAQLAESVANGQSVGCGGRHAAPPTRSWS